LRLTLKLTALLALLVSVAWLFFRPGFDSLVAVAAALVAFIAALLMKKESAASHSQNQTVTEGAIGVQAGRDATLTNAKAGDKRAGK
jgi:hypothetical protein